MFTTAFLAVSLALSATQAPTPPPACAPEFSSRFAPLAKVFTTAERFRQGAQGGKTSFTDLVKQGVELRKLATRELEKIQEIGCDLNEEDTQRFDACVSPIQWSCESLPPSIDWAALKDVPKSEDEAVAYALTINEGQPLGVDLLSENAGFSDIGCADFGCPKGSVSMPSLLDAPEKVDQLVTLATRPGFFGERAVRVLERMGGDLAKASCSIEGGWRPESPAEMKTLIEHLNTRREALPEKEAQAARVRKALQKLVAALKRGVPKKQCKMPGY